MKVKECMGNNVYWLKPENTILDCAKLMGENHIGCVPVCNTNQNVVGLVTDRDIILRGIAWDKDVKSTPISEIMTTKVCCCDEEAEIKDAQELMCKNQIRRLPVIDTNSKIKGVISLGDLAKNDNVNNGDVVKTFETICKYDNKNAE